MFKAALEATQRNGQDADLGVNSISPEAFVTVSHKFGFLSGDHRTYMPPRPLTRRDSMNTQHESVDGLRVLNHADDSTTLDEEDEGSSSDKVSRNVGPGTEDGHDVSITQLNAARRSNFALDEVVEGSAPHSNKEWGQQGETRKQRVKLARRNSMIHQSAHELVLGKVQALLAKASAQFGEKHPKVAETLFIMRAYKRNTTDRTSFHRLTRVTQALAELLEEAEKIDNADLIMGRDATMLLQQQTAEKNQSDEDSEDANEEEDEISGGENENEKDAGGSIVVVVENAAELDI